MQSGWATKQKIGWHFGPSSSQVGGQPRSLGSPDGQPSTQVVFLGQGKLSP